MINNIQDDFLTKLTSVMSVVIIIVKFVHLSIPLPVHSFICLSILNNKNLTLVGHIIYFWNHQDKTYAMEILFLNILQFQKTLNEV